MHIQEAFSRFNNVQNVTVKKLSMIKVKHIQKQNEKKVIL